MTLLELQNILGDRINVTMRTDLSPEERRQENAQSALIMGIAKQMINNGDLILRAEKLAAQDKNLSSSVIYTMIK